MESNPRPSPKSASSSAISATATSSRFNCSMIFDFNSSFNSLIIYCIICLFLLYCVYYHPSLPLNKEKLHRYLCQNQPTLKVLFWPFHFATKHWNTAPNGLH